MAVKLKLPSKISKINRTQLIIFAAVFAVVGGFFIWRALAAPVIPNFNMSYSPSPTVPWNTTATLNFSVSYQYQLDCSSNVGRSGEVNWSGNSQTLHVDNAQSGFQWYVICYADPSTHHDQSIFVNVGSPPPPPSPSPPSLSLSASPSTIIKGNSSSLTWNVSGATSCSASGGWSGSKSSSSGSHSQNVSPSSSSTYTLMCSNSGGNTTKSTSVTVKPPFPTVSLSASPTTITKGKSSTLNWSSSNASTCSATWTNSHSTSGSKAVSPASTKTYGITCSNSTGSRSATRTVYVTTPGSSSNPKPITKLVASPSSIAYKGYTYLQWSSAYSSSCSASWTSSHATVGTQKTPRLTSSRTYSISCSGPGGSSSGSARVSVASSGASSSQPKDPAAPTHDIAPTDNDDFGFSDGDTTPADQTPAPAAKTSNKSLNWVAVLIALPFVALLLWWIWLKSPLITWIKLAVTLFSVAILIALLLI